MRNILSVLTLIVLTVSAALAQNDYPQKAFQQNKIEGIYSAYAVDVAIHPTNADIIIIATGGGLYKSTDKGENWTHIILDESNAMGWNIATFRAIVFKPDNGNIVYASTGEVIFKSEDAGDNWEIIFQPNESMTGCCESIVFDQNNYNTLYACGFQGIIKTTNSGDNWNKIRDTGAERIMTGSGNSVAVIEYGPEGERMAVFSNDDFVTADTINSALPPFSYTYDESNNIIDSTGITGYSVEEIVMEYYSDNIIIITCPDMGVYKSFDKGETWIEELSFSIAAFEIEVDPKNRDILYAGTEYQVFKSINKGDSWTKEHKGNLYRLLRCDISASSDEVWFVGENGLVHKSTSGTWSEVSEEGIENMDIRKILANENSSIITVITDEIFHSPDNGASWTNYKPKITNALEPQYYRQISIKDIKFVSTDTIYIVGSSHDNGTVFMSINKGSNWNNITPHYVNTIDSLNLGQPCTQIAVDPNNFNIIYANSQNDSILYKSTNAGSTWTRSSNGLNSEVVDLLIDHQNSNIIYALCVGAEIYKSVDAGQNWTLNYNSPVANGYWYLIMNPYDSKEIIAVQAWSEVITRTTDGGANWTEITMPGEISGYNIAFDLQADESIVHYATINGELCKSTDGCQTWEFLTYMLPQTAPKGYTCIFKQEDKLLLGAYNSGLQQAQTIVLDSTYYTSAINCLNDQTATIEIKTDKYYDNAVYSINKGETTQSDSLFSNLPKGEYYPIVIIGNDTLSQGNITIEAKQHEFVNLGDDVNITTNDTHEFDAGSQFSSYLWNDSSTEQTFLVDGSVYGEGNYDIWVKTTDEFGCFSSDTVVINIEQGVGINVANNIEIKLYPNPAQSIINIEGLAVETARVFDLNGQLVEIIETNTQNTINVGHLNSGLYLLEINGLHKVRFSRL